MHKHIHPFVYGNVPLQKLPELDSGNFWIGQTYAPRRWNFLGSGTPEIEDKTQERVEPCPLGLGWDFPERLPKFLRK